MFRLVTDENFDHDIVRAILLQLMDDIDLMASREVGLAGAEDPDLLA